MSVLNSDPLNASFPNAVAPQYTETFHKGALHGINLIELEGICIAAFESQWSEEQVVADLKQMMHDTKAVFGLIVLSPRDRFGPVPAELIQANISFYPSGPDILQSACQVAAQLREQSKLMDLALSDLDAIANGSPKP